MDRMAKAKSEYHNNNNKYITGRYYEWVIIED